jgi:hypothetical protein
VALAEQVREEDGVAMAADAITAAASS